MLETSAIELLKGLAETDLSFAEIWCDLNQVWELCSAGLVAIDVARKRVSLTDEGRLALEASTSPGARKPIWSRRGTAHKPVPDWSGPKHTVAPAIPNDGIKTGR